VVERLGRGEEIAVAEGEKVGPVMGEQRKAAVELREFVEIEGEQEDAIDKAVLFGGKAVMQHGAFVEAGSEGEHSRRK
jgi:hypothetical protein